MCVLFRMWEHYGKLATIRVVQLKTEWSWWVWHFGRPADCITIVHACHDEEMNKSYSSIIVNCAKWPRCGIVHKSRICWDNWHNLPWTDFHAGAYNAEWHVLVPIPGMRPLPFSIVTISIHVFEAVVSNMNDMYW